MLRGRCSYQHGKGPVLGKGLSQATGTYRPGTPVPHLRKMEQMPWQDAICQQPKPTHRQFSCQRGTSCQQRRSAVGRSNVSKLWVRFPVLTPWGREWKSLHVFRGCVSPGVFWKIQTKKGPSGKNYATFCQSTKFVPRVCEGIHITLIFRMQIK